MQKLHSAAPNLSLRGSSFDHKSTSGIRAKKLVDSISQEQVRHDEQQGDPP
jgi:hypothetical protein